MKTADIREKFLQYFSQQGHTIEPSSSLIPHNDKTLLFVNAGMVPFKDVFSGVEKRPYTRAVSSQRCVRAGGKHNDLENVGYTARHHTFFEMLGNFSFGDYFKQEAIEFAWHFLTVELNIPKEKLWVSVYEQDDEAEAIWVNKIGFPRNRISRCGAKDNFWQMGDTGPCGPCSEIFYDHGAHIAGGPPGHVDEDGDRYIEIWNLVFTQFDRQADGHLKPLSAPCVDTGMGLERIAAVMQHKNNNYDIDLFASITKYLAKLANVEPSNASIRVIADHIRSCCFLIADGVLPSNEGRGYVLRRIIRRAIRHGHKIGIEKVFFYRLAPILALEMGGCYPELKQNLTPIEASLKKEEERFLQTLDQGLSILEQAISNLSDKTLSGEVVFKLYDTYGFPVDLTADIAKERNLLLDVEGFEAQMSQQKTRAKQANNFKQTTDLAVDCQSEFLGYDQLDNNSYIEKILHDGQFAKQINTGDEAIIVLLKTVFYPQAGGQEGDKGQLIYGEAVFNVLDTKKQASGAILHYGVVEKGQFSTSDKVEVLLDKNNRKNTARNHSATHLLHAALKQILGENVTQKGSLVDGGKLRFDFSYDKVIPTETLDKIESIVNRKILGNTKVHTEIMDIESAKKQGAIALFGEKYGNTVRVLSMAKDNFSVELCGGTHVDYLGDIGLFRITSEAGVAAGVRRIEALTGYKAYQYDKNIDKNLSNIAGLLKTNTKDAYSKTTQLIDNYKQLERQFNQLQSELASAKGRDLVNLAQKIGDIKLLCTKVEGVKAKDLRNMVDQLKQKLGSSIVVLASVENDRISLIVGVSADLTQQYNAGKILSNIAIQVGGKGGGRADMAQGGGSNVAKLDEALASVEALITT